MNLQKNNIGKCQIIKIRTPRKYLLNGLYFGPNRPKQVFIVLHGLGGTIFSLLDLMARLANQETGVIVFNNRGHGTISRIRRENKRSLRGYDGHTVGMAHEVFTDCLDDIDGTVNFALQLKPKNIFLVGHSTGCQKSVYYLAKRRKSVVRGAVLLAPMSDYADMYSNTDKKKYQQLIVLAKKMVAKQQANGLLPANLWPVPLDAQRFLSLFSPDSVEEIFSYASGKQPRILQSVNKPLLVVLAENDEYRDRPIADIAVWFDSVLKNKAAVEIIKGAIHNFGTYEKIVVKKIKDWQTKVLN